MASQLRENFQTESPVNELELDNLEIIPNQVSPVQWEGNVSNSSIAQLNIPPNNNGSCAKQELQTLWEMFTSWLQPEKQSKEQMISQLVVEQFLKTGRCKNTFAIKEKWESSGRNMTRFMEGLTDECLKPPVMVHVSMQGQEALFPENMSLKEVIKLLKEQQSLKTAKQQNVTTPLQFPQDNLLATGYENSEDGQNMFLKGHETNSVFSSPENVMYSQLIIQTGKYPQPEEAGVSYGVPLDLSRASEGSSLYQAESLRAPSYEHITMVVQPVYLSCTYKSEDTEDGHYINLTTTNVNCGVSNLKNQRDSLLIIQRGQNPEPEQRGVSYGVLGDSARAIWGTSRSQAMSLTTHSSGHISREIPGYLSRPEQPTSEPVPLWKCHKGIFICEGHQEKLQKELKPYKCEECPRTFGYPCNLSVHQKSHTVEKSFFSTHGHTGFYESADLCVPEAIPKPEKPFTCSICGKSFNHKTNLQAHERIHTGEKPYTCSLCNSQFRQSSTYNRHLRNYHKRD
ncbi:zinc finger and SCAN domain containing protein 4D-like [Mesocricetus auratus]|uniref:Zinc finger and SCAN domain containing protein 4D-like n=1 Tax=Mesocricetus auratus TaxID=10036 RepID=A0ABM2WFY3_MESAU|nr:zinc finger and SCAN domain containing protein 4D-like [Mesocricetus auratus]